MGCRLSRPGRQSDTTTTQASTEKQEQHGQQVDPASGNKQDSRPLLSGPIDVTQSILTSSNGFASLSTGESPAKPLPAFSFVNGGLLGPSGPPARETTDAGNARHSTCLGTIPIRAYGCERDIINAYYIYIHPYLSLLPAPSFPQYEDQPTEVIPLSLEPDRSILPLWPDSPLALALSALLVLIPLAKESDPLSAPPTAYRRSYAQLQSAEQALNNHTENGQGKMFRYASIYTLQSPSLLHPHLLASHEPILALLVLTVYDYCQCGNTRHMRLRAHQALTAAMLLSLHTMGLEAGDAQKQTWWMMASIFNHSVPIMLLHDPRITTPYPEFQAAASKTGLPRATADDNPRLDSAVLTLGVRIDTSAKDQEGAEASAAYNLLLMACLFVHTARIQVHRFIAFSDYPPGPDKNWNRLSTTSPAPSQGWTLGVDSTFPFSTQDSMAICLKSALVVSRTIRRLPWPNPCYIDAPPTSIACSELTDRQPTSVRPHLPRSLPYHACCTVHSSYVLAMLLQRLRASLYTRDLSACHNLLGCPQQGIDIQDIDRLVEELRNAIGSL